MSHEKEEGQKPLPEQTNTIFDLADLIAEKDQDLYERKRDRYIKNLDKNLRKEGKISP